MFKHKLKLSKQVGKVFTPCPFCTGYIPVDLEVDNSDDQIIVKGLCKKCNTYFKVRTNRCNVICDWV